MFKYNVYTNRKMFFELLDHSVLSLIYNYIIVILHQKNINFLKIYLEKKLSWNKFTKLKSNDIVMT